MAEEYWSIDIPGLTREQAVRVRELLLADAPFGVLLLNPAETLVRGFDRPTVELMVKCLEAGLAGGELPELDRMGAMSMVEDFRDWLQQS